MSSNALSNDRGLPILLLNILGFCIFIVALLLSFHNHLWMHNAFTYLSYYIIFALTITWVVSLINLYQYKQSNALGFVRRHCKGLLISLLLSSVVFISVPKHFRVLSDETNLLSVAKSMTYYKNVENITEGRWYYEMFWATPTMGTEKRPFLFPFFISLTHTFLGYRVANVFILNHLVLWIMLFLLYQALASCLGDSWAVSGLVLVMAQPFIALSATSASFEIFNFLFILASFLGLRCFVNDPNHKTFFVLIMTLLMLANIRYESFLFLITTLLVLTIAGYIKPKFLSQSFVYGLTPFFLLPLIWQRVLLASEADPNLGSWVHAFGLVNAQHNIVLFFKYILDISGQLGYAGTLDLAGLIALVLLGVIGLTTRNAFAKNTLVLGTTSVVSLLLLFITCLLYQGGINDHPMNGRLYLPILAVLSIMPVLFMAVVSSKDKHFATGTLIAALAVFIFYHPVAVEDRLSNNLMIIRESRFLDDFLKKHADQNALIICGRPGQTVIYNYGAISYGTANSQADTILGQYKNHLYSNIYVAQFISYTTQQPLADNQIDARYELETVAETQETGTYYFRISRVKAP